MLDYARQRAIEMLKVPRRAVLASHGPGGLQVGEYSCQALGLALYLLLPGACDQLVNLEHGGRVTLLSAVWELKGEAHIIPLGAHQPELDITQKPGAKWCRLVRVEPFQMHIRRAGGWGNLETLDLAREPLDI